MLIEVPLRTKKNQRNHFEKKTSRSLREIVNNLSSYSIKIKYHFNCKTKSDNKNSKFYLHPFHQLLFITYHL